MVCPSDRGILCDASCLVCASRFLPPRMPLSGTAAITLVHRPCVREDTEHIGFGPTILTAEVGLISDHVIQIISEHQSMENKQTYVEFRFCRRGNSQSRAPDTDQIIAHLGVCTNAYLYKLLKRYRALRRFENSEIMCSGAIAGITGMIKRLRWSVFHGVFSNYHGKEFIVE